MGHQRLGYVPKSHKWDAVVESVLASANLGRSAPLVAAKTLDAAAPALATANADSGLMYTFLLLTQINVIRWALKAADECEFSEEDHAAAHGSEERFQESFVLP